MLRDVSVCYVRIPSWLREWVNIRKRFAIKGADSNWVREIDNDIRICDVKWIHETIPSEKAKQIVN